MYVSIYFSLLEVQSILADYPIRIVYKGRFGVRGVDIKTAMWLKLIYPRTRLFENNSQAVDIALFNSKFLEL